MAVQAGRIEQPDASKLIRELSEIGVPLHPCEDWISLDGTSYELTVGTGSTLYKVSCESSVALIDVAPQTARHIPTALTRAQCSLVIWIDYELKPDKRTSLANSVQRNRLGNFSSREVRESETWVLKPTCLLIHPRVFSSILPRVVLFEITSTPRTEIDSDTSVAGVGLPLAREPELQQR